MITFTDREAENIFQALRKGERVQVIRPGIEPLELVPEFINGSGILWSIKLMFKGKPVKRIAGTLEAIQRWVA